MKIRTGFVSNSSSSSFCLVGSSAEAYGNDMQTIAEALGVEWIEGDSHWDNMYQNQDKLTSALEKLGMEVHQGEEHIVFGYPVETDTTIDSQVEWAQAEFDSIGINKKARFDYGEVHSG